MWKKIDHPTDEVIEVKVRPFFNSSDQITFTIIREHKKTIKEICENIIKRSQNR